MKQTNSTNSTNSTPETVRAETPRKIETVTDLDAMKQRNSDARKARHDATESATRKLYTVDPVNALYNCDFKRNRKESPVLTTYTYFKERRDANGEIVKEETRAEIPFNLCFFAPKSNGKELAKLFDKIAYTATAKPDRATATDGKKHLDDAREIVRLIGFGVLADSVNPTTVSIMMNDARFTTGKGNRQFDRKLAELSLFGFLWATATQAQTTSAYIRDREQKKREQEQKAKERKAKREQEQKAKKAKKAKKATAPKKDATPEK